MKNSKKVYANLPIVAAIVLCFLQSNIFRLGGFQLLMSLEQQKKIQRTLTYVEKDHAALHEELNGVLYINGARRQNISMNDAQKNEIFALSEKLTSDFDELNTSFQSVYFADGKDDRYKKYFKPMTEFKRNLKVSVYEIEVDYLFDLYRQSEKAEETVALIKRYVESAKLENQQNIDAKIREMSIWQWLFGY
ncbi:hypothetical protein [Algoriphagus antarcticus]|uniref:Chemotaxis methyl-accepting receptor HlyB-like 4HB MCP domain-containing protein n=1 Tax=Algoriphagus antarcticus TaxID=238540 RepID=A0A3E0DMF6_9BACT|nr:hypothetical protein [Algoriphagus antarcticus]REG82714.1 hypothetical protein C8N25_1202 [Algoriphagus antarcticus]